MIGELDEIGKEALRPHEYVLHTELQHHIAAKYWQRCRYALGLIATIAGVLATSAAINSNAASLPSSRWIAPTVVTVLAAVIAFLKPDGKADMHHDEGVRYNDLRRKIRMFVNIELSASSQGRWPELVARVEALGSEKTSLNREKPTAPSGPIYLLAKREITKGHMAHEVDVARARDLT
jgi:hypothetical protein